MGGGIVIKYEIGASYHYPDRKEIFVLDRIAGNNEPDLCMFICHFKCGHWCTDNVFIDMIKCSTGIQVSEDIQLNLFD